MIVQLYSEFYFPYAQKWLEIRGVIMILVMKALSLSHDYDNSRYLPPLSEFLGYVCCPANCMFGPWVSFAEYCSIFRRSHKKVRKKIISSNFYVLIFILERLVGCKNRNNFSDFSFIFNDFKLLVGILPS